MSPPAKCKRVRGWTLFFPLLLLWLIQSPAFPQSALQPDDASLFREGEILLSKGDIERAFWRFKRLITEYPKSPLVNEAKFRMGICYTQLQKPKDAIRIFNELLPTFLAPTRLIQVFTLLGDNHLELKDRLSALQWYGKGLLVAGQPHEELKKKVKSIIDTYDTEEELKPIESLYRGAYAGGYAKLKLAQVAKQQKNDSLARRILTDWEKEYRGMEYGPLAKELSESIPPPKSKYTVGVILPLSGPYQLFGERVLQGIQLAIREMEPAGKTPLISLSVRDSKGSPLDTEKAVEELAAKEKVIAILGPLLSNTVEKAAKKAQQMKVPLLAFSQREIKGDFLFLNSLPPLDQVQTLVDYVTNELNLRTFAVFSPNSPYGLHYKNLFAQEVSQRGGKISGIVIYQEDQTDFSQEIKGFFKIETPPTSSAQSKKGKEFKPLHSVDGIFIPDTHDRVAMILSQMVYYDIKGTFLGTNAWNAPGLISKGGKGTEGAIFVDAFFKRESSPWVARFVEDFRKTYQRDPETLEALGYDGAKLIKEILLSKSVSSSSKLQEELQQIKNFQGISGLKGFNDDGKAIRTLFILKVTKGQIEKIAP